MIWRAKTPDLDDQVQVEKVRVVLYVLSIKLYIEYIEIKLVLSLKSHHITLALI